MGGGGDRSAAPWSLVLCLVVLASLGLSACGSTSDNSSSTGASTSTSETQVVLIPDDGGSPSPVCKQPLVEPEAYALGCGMGYELSDLEWTNWGETAATATGTARVNNCRPNCGGGTFHDFPVSITLTRIKVCPTGERQYQHFDLTFLTGKYSDIAESYRCPPTKEEQEQLAAAKKLAIQVIEGHGVEVATRYIFATRSERDPDWISVSGTTEGERVGEPYARGWSVYLKSVNGVSVVRYAGFREVPPIGGVPCDLVVSGGEPKC